jgi:predicted  nucleic acid-binding Zn-ribbon protein
MHQHFEELCALAVTGQITSQGKALLEEHARDCDECRGFLQDMGPLKDHLAPVVAGGRVQLIDPPEGVRQRFFERAAAAGMNIQAGPPLAAAFPENAVPKRARLNDVLSAAQERIGQWHPVAWRLAWPVAAGAICVMAGYTLAQWHFRGNTRPTDNVAAVAAAVSQTSATSPDTSAATIVSKLEQQKKEAEERLAVISAELAKAQTEKLVLTRDLSAVSQQAAVGAEAQRRLEEEQQKARRTESLVASLQTELDAARKKQADLDVILNAQQNTAQDATARLARLQAELDRGGDTSLAKTQAEEMISARNLHIVDVYDTQTNGKRQKSFGRVFYVEGRSLVFYAYDLPNPKHPNKNLAFHVWGEKAGAKATTFQLGIMHPDDPAQQRWVLTFDDPRVLNRINAVYITTDPPAQSSPHGRQFMYAFLGSPNHP